jgi:hypothetical protein
MVNFIQSFFLGFPEAAPARFRVVANRDEPRPIRTPSRMS